MLVFIFTNLNVDDIQMKGIIILLIVVGLIVLLFWQSSVINSNFLFIDDSPTKNKQIVKKGLHIGIIPDGNRRWVTENGRSKDELFDRWRDMEKFFNLEVFKEKLRKEDPSLEKYIDQISELSLYVLSDDNLKRNDFSLPMVFKVIKQISEIDKIDAKINIAGDIRLLPDYVVKNIKTILKKSNNKSKYTINLAIAYDPVKDIELFPNLNRNQSQIDLVLRSGRERRSSGFFPCHCLYSEWYFTDKLWPDIEDEDLIDALKYYSKRQRRFGK